jgi:phospholipid/cholesterol/gamma-HCH transport system substrate-binding protein
MSQRSTDVKVGITVIAAALILILGIVWIGEFRMNRKWATYSVYFTEVGGLNPGDPVTIAGLEMGKVGAITLEGSRVKADLLIDEKARLKRDCSIEIRSIGLMGEKFVYIWAGSAAEVLPPGSTIDGKYKAGLTEMTIVMEDVVSEIKALSQTLRKTLEPVAEEQSLGKSLAKLNEMADEILGILRENRDDLKGAAGSARAASENLNEILGGRKQELAAGLDRFVRASARLDSLSAVLQSLAVGLDKGEGTLGALLKEKKLHQDLEATVRDLDELIKDIKEHPERYTKIEIF